MGPLLCQQHVDALEVLLQGLCGGLRETVKVHEICLKTGPNLGKSVTLLKPSCLLYNSWFELHVVWKI
jgi:mediator of RNA polymerase II transcription subunit 18